jgi:hypothetical protein
VRRLRRRRNSGFSHVAETSHDGGNGLTAGRISPVVALRPSRRRRWNTAALLAGAVPLVLLVASVGDWRSPKDAGAIDHLLYLLLACAAGLLIRPAAASDGRQMSPQGLPTSHRLPASDSPSPPGSAGRPLAVLDVIVYRASRPEGRGDERQLRPFDTFCRISVTPTAAYRRLPCRDRLGDHFCPRDSEDSGCLCGLDCLVGDQGRA